MCIRDRCRRCAGLICYCNAFAYKAKRIYLKEGSEIYYFSDRGLHVTDSYMSIIARHENDNSKLETLTFCPISFMAIIDLLKLQFIMKKGFE